MAEWVGFGIWPIDGVSLRFCLMGLRFCLLISNTMGALLVRAVVLHC